MSDLAAFALGARAVTQASHPLRAPIVDLMGMTPSWDEDLHFVLRDGSRLPYAAASSMVRALLGLDLFVASAPGERDVLVIDEPELSAHPKAQLAIIEILATCVQRGDRVLLTTHSPYLVDHLANLLAASRLPEGARRQVADRFALRDPRAFVDPEQVAVYEFVEAGDRIEVVDRLDRERGSLDLDTFAEQTDRLSAVYGAVLDLEVPKARAVR